MSDRNVVDLSQRRAEGERQRRKAARAGFKPAPWVIAWTIFLAVAIAGYFWSGASSRYQKTVPTGVTD
ncbi:hypothetical protein [Hyphomicrobium sp.]|uniref:hypothetical protein n=1 Tax=Hyphomicrobium sp. TaxID=82 RepID=UPI002E30CFA5|nr:hypothetical protein [Hyphomicrobium sp.]HEX2842172.1 hypothetical protein [Hyphomicrobium sp.]